HGCTTSLHPEPPGYAPSSDPLSLSSPPVGMGRREILKKGNSYALQLPTGMTRTVVTLLAFGGIWVVGDRVMLRQVHALVQTTERVAAGNLSARIGVPYHLSELGQLAHAFDVMAEQLSVRQVAATRAEEALATHAERLRILHE